MIKMESWTILMYLLLFKDDNGIMWISWHVSDRLSPQVEVHDFSWKGAHLSTMQNNTKSLKSYMTLKWDEACLLPWHLTETTTFPNLA